ncbi:Asp23/Gls24 family envelope stress response protein [Streptomyces varsoviensis]|uniref:Asp23/Gls24 family envelope stress response protein n=1 Tax=Streptomyces varsoviensis TaxID=67373 RepID=UPI00066260C2|nr:Asp23/Gls24 family envelope stress response protein [Streptomyces varsoviensis]
MALDDATDDATLPCGRTLSTVWDSEGDDPHVAGCPHCQEALAGLGVLDSYVRQARAAADPPAEEITARVMDLVRAELRPGRPLPLGEPEEDAWIVETAAARTFRAAAESLSGVLAGSCRVVPLDAEAVRGTTERGRAPYRGPLRVTLEVAATADWTVPELADRVRELVAEAARRTVGMDVAEIDVSVVDILDEEPPTTRRSSRDGERRPR